MSKRRDVLPDLARRADGELPAEGREACAGQEGCGHAAPMRLKAQDGSFIPVEGSAVHSIVLFADSERCLFLERHQSSWQKVRGFKPGQRL